MARLFLLARRSISFHRYRSAIIALCLGVTIALPVSVRVMVWRFQQQVSQRAEATPLVIGPRTSRFDLVLHALYFQSDVRGRLKMELLDEVADGLAARAIPLHAGHRAQQQPVVGTTADYFAFRQLELASGQDWQRLGDCLLGASVARRLQLQTEDSLLTDPLDPFNIVGTAPLKMRVVGLLAANGSADDNAVFVSLETAWVIEGIGHGHQNVEQEQHGQLGMSASFTEVTDNNLDSFHFHGSRSSFPLTAILAVAENPRQATLLEARFLDPESTVQSLRPVDVVEEMMGLVFRAQQFFDLLAVLMAAVTIVLLGLVIALSQRLRAREMRTMVKIGSSRSLTFWLQATELGLLCLAGLLFAAALVAISMGLLPQLMDRVISA
jgi:putative ABC transport system permease protein